MNLLTIPLLILAHILSVNVTSASKNDILDNQDVKNYTSQIAIACTNFVWHIREWVEHVVSVHVDYCSINAQLGSKIQIY